MNMKLLITLMAAALVSSPVAAEVAQQAEVSVQQVHLDTKDGNKSHKFTEYKTMPNGVVIERYSLDADWENYVLSCEARKVGYDDQDYKCSGGKPGLFTYKFGWDQTPHVYTNQARTPYYENGRGNYELPDQIQLDIQNNLNVFVASRAVNNYSFQQFLKQSPFLTSKTRDDKATLDLRYRPMDPLTVNLGVMRFTKQGNRPMGASFGFGQPVELLEPIDYETYEMNVGAEFVKPEYQFGGAYQMSKFENKTDTLIWDSFKRLTDQYNNANGYSTGDQSGKGRMALNPSNMAHTFSLNGGVDLPAHTRFSGEVSYAMWLAKNEMLPYTINSAMTPAVAGTVPNLTGPGNAGYVPPFDASSMANRPGTDVDSRIDVYMMNWKLVNKAIHDLKLMIEWKTLAEVNKSQQFLLPGHAVFDQRWATEELDTKRESFHRDRLTFKADYELSHPVSVAFDYSVERERRTREVETQYEHLGTIGTTIRPDQKNLINVSYTLALRRGRDYNEMHNVTESTGGVGQLPMYYFETPGLRRFDTADRNRNKGRVQWQYTADNGFMSAFSAYGYYDKYRPGKGGLDGGLATRANTMYGILEDRNIAVATDLTIPLGEAWEILAFYEWEMQRRMLKSNYANSSTITQLAINEWQVRVKELSNVGSLSANWKKDAWNAGIGYDVVASVLKEDLVHRGAGANVRNWHSLPNTNRTTQTFRLNGGYKLTKNLKINGRYMYEKFDVRDFANEDIPLQAWDNAIYVGASVKPYRAHVASLGLDYRF